MKSLYRIIIKTEQVYKDLYRVLLVTGRGPQTGSEQLQCFLVKEFSPTSLISDFARISAPNILAPSKSTDVDIVFLPFNDV